MQLNTDLFAFLVQNNQMTYLFLKKFRKLFKGQPESNLAETANSLINRYLSTKSKRLDLLVLNLFEMFVDQLDRFNRSCHLAGQYTLKKDYQKIKNFQFEEIEDEDEDEEDEKVNSIMLIAQMSRSAFGTERYQNAIDRQKEAGQERRSSSVSHSSYTVSIGG